MSLNLPNITIEFLKRNSAQRYTAREIAEWVFSEFPEECENKKNRSNVISTDNDLIQQITSEIYGYRVKLESRFEQLRSTDDSPKRLYWTENFGLGESTHKPAEDDEIKPSRRPDSKFSEHDIYPLLCSYLHSQYGIYPKRIDDKRSSNKQGKRGNRWLYPDIVGMQDMQKNWHDAVKNIVQNSSDNTFKLWSFEVKVILNNSNLRESFFQAVSNSSWANVGYLVASNISGTNTLSETRMLSSLHGIGLIKVNVDNFAESEILVPAREKQSVDWTICSRIAEENADFRDFLKLVGNFLATADTHKVLWDIP